MASPRKRRAFRLYIYLSVAGIQAALCGPDYDSWLPRLEAQYEGLSAAQRQLARRQGRQLIKQAGDLMRAAALLGIAPSIQTRAKPSLDLTRPLSKADKFELCRRRWPNLTPPCRSCLTTRYRFPKRCWPSHAVAEAVRNRQHDREMLRSYECPVQPGVWHLGHVRRIGAVYSIPKQASDACLLPASEEGSDDRLSASALDVPKHPAAR